MSSPLTKETMSPTCGEKRPLPEDDNDEVLVPAARRRRPSAVLKESMESAVSNHNSTDAAQEEGSENENFKLRKYLPKKSAIVWTEDEDKALREAVEEHGTEDWIAICEQVSKVIGPRTASQCLRRWQATMKLPVVKGNWTAQEDEKIAELVQKYGAKKWAFIASSLPGRKAKQCRERWCNHVNPDISKKSEWTEDEDRIILETLQTLGPKWSSMARQLPGRTDNSTKNHFNASMRRKIIKYLSSKKGEPLNAIPKMEDGRFDLMGDLEGTLAAVRAKKIKVPVEKKPRKKKEPKGKPVKDADKKAPKKTAAKKEPKQMKTRAVTAAKKKERVVKAKATRAKKKRNKSTKQKLPAPIQSLKTALAKKDRVAMTWEPRESEPVVDTPESSSTAATGASILLSLSSSSEIISPLKGDCNAVKTSQQESPPSANCNEDATRRPASLPGGCQDVHAPTMEGAPEFVSC